MTLLNLCKCHLLKGIFLKLFGACVQHDKAKARMGIGIACMMQRRLSSLQSV